LLIVPLSKLPRVDRLELATINSVPDLHPEYDTFEPFPVHAWVIRHPDGTILVDTGVGLGIEAIDGWYHPQITPLSAALEAIGLGRCDITAVVISHLHFDHCGQQATLSAPTYVQALEFEVAQEPGYTVPDWAAIPTDRLRLVRGDEDIADGVRLLSTPGHTPGHQSVCIEAGDERVILAAQCAYRAEELHSGQPAASNLPDASWADAARDSLQHLRALAPATLHLSHDPEVVRLEQ
jgi:glyoxylase-like metal-dependent hydrolase (beta-lactamase superfamily II)